MTDPNEPATTGHDYGNNGGYDFGVKEAKILKKALDQFLMDQM